MPQSDVRINSMYPPGTQGGTRAYASATIDGCFAVRGIKLVEGGKDGLFVSMPSRKTQDGYKEICFPVTAEFRCYGCLPSGIGTGTGSAAGVPCTASRSSSKRSADGRNVIKTNLQSRKWRKTI